MRCSVDIIFGVLAALAILIEPSTSQRRSRLATGAGQPVEFDCPEEFGYYPHPTDCTQYYVCVFGGALLESCTGGLMYSHELQTCDWPRNVGCGGAGESATISTVRVTDPRTRQTTPTAQGTRAATQVTRDQVQQRQQQEEIAKHQLYADDLGPAEEIETDRQQRVYRGQPSTVGQVARDRDGLRHQPVTNSIPATRSSSADKVAVISFGNQQQTQNTQYSLDPLTEDNFLTNETTHRRKKRQARFRYPARILQIVPSGARVPWPTPPSPSVHSAGSGGNFKYQGNLNRNKPPRLTDPINAPDASFQPALNPNVSPDIRHFRSPEQYGNSKARPPPNSKFSNPDSNYGHRPPINLEPDLNVRHNSNSEKGTQNNYNSGSSNKHTGGGSSPAHSVIIPSSYATFQNLPDVPLHFASPSPALLNNSYVRNIPHTNPVYQTTEEEDNYSYFHLDHANSQNQHLSTTPPIPLFSASPTLSNLLTTLKNAEILVGQNNPQNHPATINDQNSLQLLKSLTSLHEVPYNSDGTRLYQIPQPQQHDVALNPDFNPAHLFHHIVSQNNPSFPVLGNFQSPSNPHHASSNNNAGRSPPPPVTTTQAPFTPNSNPYGIKYENEPKPQEVQQDYRQTTTPHRFAKPQMEHEESQTKKQIRPTAEYPARPAYTQESESVPSNEYTSSEEDYYDESEEFANEQYSRPPSQTQLYGSGNKFKEHANPFADINFDFDKYIDKLRGGYQTTVTHPPDSGKQKGTATGNYRKPDDYDDYSEEDYEEYEESEEKPPSNYKPHQQYQSSPNQNNKFQSSTESNIFISATTKSTTTTTTTAAATTAKYRFPTKESSSLPSNNIRINPTPQTKVPETLTVPFFHAPDGNFYSRQPIQPENSYQTEGSTIHPFPQLPNTHQPNNYKEYHNVQSHVHDTKTNGRPPPITTDPTTTEYTSLREKERVPSYKNFRENSHHSKVTTTTRPSSSSLRPVTNVKNQQEYYEDFIYTPRPVKTTVHKNRFNNSQASFEPSHIHIVPTKNYRQNESVKETTTHTNLEYSSTVSDLKEYASSTTKYPYKTSKIPNYHYSDIIVQSTRATTTPEAERPTKTPTKTINHNKVQSSQASRGPSYNSSLYNEGANIFSSVKDTISMMSNTSLSPDSNVNITPSYNKSVSSTNSRHTTLPPLPADSHTTLKTYTIRRRPSKVPSTTPRYRTRKPTTSPDNTNTGSLASSTPSRPQTVNGRQNRRPTTKNRLRSTTTERTSTTDRDRDVSTDKPKSTVIRHNKKLVPDKDGSRTTNNIRVEPSPASVSYVQQPALQASPSPPAYNNSQQYDTSQYDPYYSIYDEDVELYRDVDYTQYTGNQGQTNNQQFRGQSPYKQAPQQPEIQSQRNNGYVQPTYNTQNVYTQTAGTQDYNENYNTQLANDQIQYRQQAARQPTKAPPSSNRIESNLSYETTSTTTIPTTSTKPTTIRTTTTTTTVAPAVVSSRQQTRQRAEANRSATQPTTRTTSTTTTTTTTTTAYNIPEEFQTLWNLPVENNPSSEPSLSTLSSTINPADSLSRSANVPESPLGSQRNILSPASVTEPKPASRRITLTASLSLDEPFATGRRSGSRGPNASRRTSFSADELSSRSGSRRGSSEAVPVNVQSARSNKNVQRNQSPPRRVASKSFAIADVPSSDSQVLSRNSGIITVEDFVPLPSRVNNSETSARRSRVEAARISNVEVTQPTRGTQRKTESQDNASAPRAAKLVLESETPRQSVISAAGLKPTVESTFFSESDSESNSLTTQSLSRNTISQSEIVTPRVRSREGIQAKPCRDEVDSNSNTDCSEKPQLRVRPTTAPPDSQTTPGPTRGTSSGRNRGSPAYTASTASDTVNRGTPASVRTRPTLKPSTAIVPKAQEFIDIYRFPPRRPDSIYPTPQVDKTAAKCRKDVCLLPDCYCGGKDIPGGFEPEEIPQMVLLTFDDSANDLNKGLYHDLFETGRKNANGCPISATFYVSHEWTDYSHVQNLYAGGHEIASHSISHSFGEQFSQKKWTREIGGQREILAAYGGVKLEDVRGMRAPFLAIGGNKMFKMLYDSNFTYDSSMPVYENRPPSWPYTLDYKIFHDCMIPPCPTRSYPGVWEVPMVMWQDLNGGRCSMGDACSNPPTADGVYKMLIKNFERHYTTNRAPFGLFYHAAWFTQPHHKEGFEAFLDTIVNMQDVWLVTNWQAIQWMRDPTPLSRINSFQPWQCNYPDRPKKCNNPKVCNLWHKSGVRYMRTCQPCPDIYPWTGKTGVRNSRVDNEVIEE